MKWFLQRHYVNAVLFFALTILVLLSFISFYQIRRLNNSNAWIIHSYQVINVTNTVLMNLDYAESNMRGFVISNNLAFLNDYNQTISTVGFSLAQLQKLTEDNPIQQERIQELTELIKTRIFLLNSNIQLTKTNQAQLASKNVADGYDKKLTADIHKICYAIIEEENSLLINRTNISFANVGQITAILLLANLFNLSLILTGFILLNRHLTYRISSEKKLLESEEELTRVAYSDSLTGLPNRAFLIEKINGTLNDNNIINGSVAVLLIDIDNFKMINDSLGYETGDQLLKLFAERLVHITRASDLVTHLATDQFVIMVNDLDQVNDITIVAQKILTSAIQPFHIKEHKIYLTVSIGISISPVNGVDARTLLKNADIAMYRAKELGKNNYQFCTQEMILEVEERAFLDYYLHQAVVNEEFILLYQPKMSLRDKKMVGVEALIRWNKPKEGLIYPSHFISLAESNGLIVPIGEWMLRTACEQGIQWQKSGLPKFHIAINISPLQFILSDVVKSIGKIIEETGFDPELLEIEITENIWMRNSFNNLLALRALKEMGIKITIDDFGTGYSSLSYISTFPIDKLKIDQSFIKKMSDTHSEHNLIKAIIIMAHSLNIQVVAEGIETPLQEELLEEFNCDEVQGFLYSHPISSEKINDFFTHH